MNMFYLLGVYSMFTIYFVFVDLIEHKAVTIAVPSYDMDRVCAMFFFVQSVIIHYSDLTSCKMVAIQRDGVP